MFQQSLNGLNAFSYALDVVGHNLANSEGVGFKTLDLHFSDSLTSAMDRSFASGVSPPSTVSDFKQGTIVDTQNPLDLAIQGNGFFQLSRGRSVNADKTFYTRNGQYHLEIESWESSGSEGTQRSYITDGNGNYLMGWNAVNGAVNASQPTVPIIISHAVSPGLVTSSVEMNVNLDSHAAVPSSTGFDPANPHSYNWATTVKAYDSNGDAHNLTTYFVKTGTDAWNLYTRLDGMSPTETEPRQINFSVTGQLSDNSPMTSTFSLSGGATMPPVVINLGGSTQFGDNFSLNDLHNNGYSKGFLSNIRVAGDGTIFGDYSNGFSGKLGRIALARFPSPQGLQSIGGNLWFPSPNAGAVELWPDLTVVESWQQRIQAAETTEEKNRLKLEAAPFMLEGWGAIHPRAVEQSITNTAEDLINLVTMQRNYQANAKGIETQNQMLQSLLNIR